MKISKSSLILLIIVNALVLLGQIWPEGAPPFARYVNIIFLVTTFTTFISLLKNLNDNTELEKK